MAGVSPAIVSLVVNGRVDGNVRISAQTRQRVWDAVRELGYVVNPVARRLAGGKNQLLGVFTYEPIFPLSQQSFYYRFLVGIEEEAEAQDYDLLLFTRTGGPNGVRSIYKDGVNSLQLADGAVLLGANENRAELSRLLREGFPFVYVGRREVAGGEISYSAADYVAATVEVVGHAVKHGHRRLAYLRNRGDNESSRDRDTGYRLAHDRFGLPLDERQIRRVAPEEITSALLQALLAAGTTAFICEHIGHAARLLECARAIGKRVPDDFSLAMLGNPMSDETIPDLTTFLIPRREMGARAVKLLVHILANPDDPGPHRIVLPCTFVPGQTVAAAP